MCKVWDFHSACTVGIFKLICILSRLINSQPKNYPRLENIIWCNSWFHFEGIFALQNSVPFFPTALYIRKRLITMKVDESDAALYHQRNRFSRILQKRTRSLLLSIGALIRRNVRNYSIAREIEYLDVSEHVLRERLLADLSGVLILPLTDRPSGTQSDVRNVTAINKRLWGSGKYNDILQYKGCCHTILAKCPLTQ